MVRFECEETAAPRSCALARASVLSTLSVALVAWTAPAASVSAQNTVPDRTEQVTYEQVTYRSARDSTLLTATLALPPGTGPHPGVVALSVAGTDRLVERLTTEGYAVLTPVRRGFVAVEPLLRATYRDLADDALAALDHLGSLDSVDREALALVAQADDAPPAILAMAGSDDPVPLVLLAPPMSPGVETFRREQRWLAERERADEAELRALDGYIDEIAGVVLSESAPSVREYHLQRLRERSNIQLPRNAAFPADERQAHFFASPLWHDRLAFDPEVAMAPLASPVLVLIGATDANTPMDRYLAAAGRALSAARTRDAAVCRVPGRTRHAFTDEVVSIIAEWLPGRVAASAETGAGGAAGLSGCLDAG